MVKISPSLLSLKDNELESKINEVIEAGADYIHIDVMDGKFVPNTTDGLKMIRAIKDKKTTKIDVHLMVEHPENEIGKYIGLADIITFHIEAVDDKTANEIIYKLKSNNIKVGISIKPKTEVERILQYIGKVDMILVMTVEPGFGGQKLIEDTLIKIKEIKKIAPNILIEVDGGINIETAQNAKESGADILVAGTAVFGSNDIRNTVDILKN